MVIALSEDLRGAAIQVANKLRGQGRFVLRIVVHISRGCLKRMFSSRAVDIVLGKKKKMAWAYSYADRVGAKRVLLVAPTEWAAGKVRIKYLRASKGREEEATNEEDVPFSELK